MPNLASPRESSLLVVSLSLICLVDSIASRNWQIDVARLEDGWTIVKGKKSQPSIPPLDMNFWSYKGGSKSISKS